MKRLHSHDLGRLVSAGAIGALLLFSTTTRAQEAGDGDATVHRIPVSGVIELGLAPFIERSLRDAEQAGASAAILDIETPGGRVDAAQRIANALAESPIPVYAFVNHRAFSAGALIALATDGVFMRSGSVMGAATPVTGEGQKAPEKIVSAMRSEMRALAESRGLDPRVAEAMVDEDIEIPGVVDQGKLLTLTTDEAVRLGYATEVESYADLLDRLGLADAETLSAEINWAERLVRFLTNPVLTPLLLSLGFLGLLIEVKTPGFGLAGGAGLLSLGLFFGSHYLVGLAGLEELLVLGLGLVLLGIEVFVVPGFGVFGILGILGIVGGIYMSLLGQFSTVVDYTTAAGVIATSIILVLITAWAIVRTLPSNSRLARSGILLGQRTSRETGYLSAAARVELVGLEGTAVTDLRPAGVGIFGDERIDVVAETGWIEEGTPIRIIRAEGYRHVVRPAPSVQPEGTANLERELS